MLNGGENMNIPTMPDIVVTNVYDTVRLLDSPVGVSITMTDRKQWGIVLKKEGRTVYTANGKQILSDSLHPVILPRGCSYSWICEEAGLCQVIQFDATAEDIQLYPVEITDNSRLLTAFDRIAKALAKGTVAGQMECRQLLYGALAFLASGGQREYVPSGKHQLLQPAVDHMNTCYFETDITNDALAKLCGISTVYFRKSFETVYGVSPIKYLNNLRMRKARSLLESDYASIAQVAESVGYSSIYHFSKMFRQYAGVSPKEYARQHGRSE